MTSRTRSAPPTRRTGHACTQCRERKQKCGGFTYKIKCRPCISRKVKCSFEEAANDPRLNPYLRLHSSKSPTSSNNFVSSNDTSPTPESVNLSQLLQAFDQSERPSEHVGTGSISQQLETLHVQIADLERHIGLQRNQADSNETVGFTETIFVSPFDTGYKSSPIPSHPTSQLIIDGLANAQRTTCLDGPLSTLNNIRTDDTFEFEKHDPIARSILTAGEASVLFKLFFSHCHPIAPFLDVGLDSDLHSIRSRSMLLFLAILCVGARFWCYSSKSSCWLHPRYSELVHLLDKEMARVALRPVCDDSRIETVQGLILCAHWMPLDFSGEKKQYSSRFWEGAAWQYLGVAIRWATFLSLERSCLLSMQHPEKATREEVGHFRTMLYLAESDHYLALSARRPPSLNPGPLSAVLANFLRCKDLQTTDVRLTSLFRVACGTHITKCRPASTESVEAFDTDVQIIEGQFNTSLGGNSTDAMSEHFPFTSLRWYRLSYTCAFLDIAGPTERSGKALSWAIEWASQILFHLSRAASEPTVHSMAHATYNPLEPDPSVVSVMSFAIDHYFVVIAYAAFFLVNVWLSNLMDLNLQTHSRQADDEMHDASTSKLFRLVDLCVRTLEAASPCEGHLARRYVPLLRGMMSILQSGRTQTQNLSEIRNGVVTSLAPSKQAADLGEDLWSMWEEAGLETNVLPSMLDFLLEGSHQEPPQST
ncbi:hypothetical protein BCR39DRAFT_508725 [Naematelia encephala]|uniref:Zn(2)-C6 fungal-type domain-containing protein n=1 Tax=Naematelia encephala TaxID=71784 RepID=A0A1Y2BKM2_9TREE|nr:hypothetical protein BCR39DRAFT_508725 [Naematelia encephala]